MKGGSPSRQEVQAHKGDSVRLLLKLVFPHEAYLRQVAGHRYHVMNKVTVFQVLVLYYLPGKKLDSIKTSHVALILHILGQYIES